MLCAIDWTSPWPHEPAAPGYVIRTGRVENALANMYSSPVSTDANQTNHIHAVYSLYVQIQSLYYQYGVRSSDQRTHYSWPFPFFRSSSSSSSISVTLSPCNAGYDHSAGPRFNPVHTNNIPKQHISSRNHNRRMNALVSRLLLTTAAGGVQEVPKSS